MSDYELKVGALLRPKKLPLYTGYAVVTTQTFSNCFGMIYGIVTDYGYSEDLTLEEVDRNYEVYGHEPNIKMRILNHMHRLLTCLEQLDD